MTAVILPRKVSGVKMEVCLVHRARLVRHSFLVERRPDSVLNPLVAACLHCMGHPTSYYYSRSFQTMRCHCLQRLATYLARALEEAMAHS